MKKDLTSVMDNLLENLDKELKEFLRQEDRIIPMMFASLERTTGYPREKIVYWLLVAISVYLVIGHFSELLCNTICFAYPAAASLEAIETLDKDEIEEWLTYWTVFGTISLVDFAADKIMATFPIYWFAKCVFFLWMYMPFFRGAQYLHKNFVGPIYRRLRPGLRAAAIEVKEGAQKAAVNQLLAEGDKSEQSESSESEESSESSEESEQEA